MVSESTNRITVRDTFLARGHGDFSTASQVNGGLKTAPWLYGMPLNFYVFWPAPRA